MLHAAAEAVAAFAAGGYFTVAEGISTRSCSTCSQPPAPATGSALTTPCCVRPIGVVQQRVRDRRIEPEHAGALADAAVVEDLWTQFESLASTRATGSMSAGVALRRSPSEIDRRLRAGEFLLETGGQEPPAARRCLVVLCTGSLSKFGSTCLPKVSTASSHESIDMEVDSMPKESWSAPVARVALDRLAHLVGVPTATSPEAMTESSVAASMAGMISGHSGRPGGFGKVSRYRNTRLRW